MHLCSLITKSHLPWARVLVRSFLEHHPGAGATVLCVDDPEGRFDPAAEPFEVLTLADLDVDDVWGMALRYSRFEFTMALKPWLLRHVVERHGETVYLDSDMRVYAPLEPLSDALGTHDVVVTPHLAVPLPDDGRQPDEEAILAGGVFNAGLFAAKPGDLSERLLDWWAKRLRTGCRREPERGLFVDQRWLELTAGMFPDIHVLRDVGTNVAYWNLPVRKLHRGEDGAWCTDEVPLRCFHFSGFDPATPDRLSAYDNRYAEPEQSGELSELCSAYARELEQAGVRECAGWPYSWDTTASGMVLAPWLRRLVGKDRQSPETAPFTDPGEAAFLAHWNAPAARGGRHGLTRLMEAWHDSRPDLAGTFPDLEGGDGYGFREWVFAEGRAELPEPLLPLAPTQVREAAEPLTPGLHELAPGASLGAARGDTVVCIPVYGAHDMFVRCLASVLEHTPRSAAILVADDASPDMRIRGFVEELASSGRLNHHVAYLRQAENSGFVANVNAALAAAAPADVLVVNSDCVVARGWLTEMRAAAYADTNVATASALTNHGTILSVPYRNRPMPDLPQDVDFERAAARLRKESSRCHPRIPTAVGHCVYIRRDALDLVGDFDLAFSPGYGEEVDFSQRCAMRGMVHVAADGALVLHRQGGTFGAGETKNLLQDAHERQLEQRYPFYGRTQGAAGCEDFGPLPRALAAARRSIRSELSVTIDGRILRPVPTGTQLHVLEVIGAVSRVSNTRVRVIIPPDLGDYARDALSGLPIELLPHTAVQPGMERTDVVHRPFQVTSDADLDVLRWSGERCVITHQDLIAYRNPGYFAAFPQWDRFRRLTRRALAIADAVVFFSEHVARDALNDDLVDDPRTNVVHLGVDHALISAHAPPRVPEGAEDLEGREFLMCLGTDFRHKNRVFALRLLEALQRRHGWSGRLVLAGPRVSEGSSAGDEAEFLATRPEVATAVVQLPAIGDNEKEWLYAHASGCLYPTLYEGFGLIPFESSERGVPCFFAPVTSLQEVLPREAAVLVPWDADASADSVAAALSDQAASERLVELVREHSRRFTWDRAGAALVDVYHRAARAPSREAAFLAWDGLRIERERAELERKYNELWTVLEGAAHDVVGPDSPLTPELQHSLRAILNRPPLRAPLLGALRLGTVVRHAVGRASDGSWRRPDSERIAAFYRHFETPNRMHMSEQLASEHGDELIGEP